MYIYFITIGIALFWAFLYEHRKRTIFSKKEQVAENVVIFLAIAPLIFISGCRYFVGQDYENYLLWYEKGKASGFSNIILDIVFYFMRMISDSGQFFFIVSSIFILGCILITIFKESMYPFMSLYLFVFTRGYFRSMNVVRQYVAVAVIMFSIRYIKERDLKKFLIITILATLIHPSAVLMFLIYFLYDIKITPKIVALVGVFVYFGGFFIRNYFVPLISKYTEYGNYFLQDSSYYESSFKRSLLYIYIIIFIMLTIQYYKNNLVVKLPNYKILYNTIFVGIILLLLTNFMPRNFWRIVWYLDVFLTIYLPENINYINSKIWRNLFKLFIYMAFFILTIVYIGNGEQAVLPYRCFLWN